MTALALAAVEGHADLVAMLIQAGADVNYCNSEVTSLSFGYPVLQLLSGEVWCYFCYPARNSLTCQCVRSNMRNASRGLSL
jgi:hypothetical protein